MSTADELVKAIRERIAAGLTKEQIQEETVTAGHKPDIFEAAYTLASSDEIDNGELPSVKELFLSGVSFVKKEWKLALLLGLPLVALSLSEIVAKQYEGNSAVLGVTALVGIVSLFVYAGLILISLQAVTQKNETTDYKAARGWAKKNFLAALWIYVLMMVVVWGGFVLFIIPGVIAGVTLYFALYTLVNEGKKGEEALLLSRQLVNGRWWIVAGKLFGLSLLFLLLVLILIMFGGILTAILSMAVEVAWWGTLFNVVSQLVGAAVSLATLYAGNQLYQALKTTSTNAPLSKTPYRMLAVLGAASMVALVTLITFLVAGGEDLSKFTDTNNTDSMRAELVGVGITASAYKFTNSGSYEGVCTLLQDSIASNSEVVCNDEESAWAMTTTKSEETWCIDSTGYNKSLEAPLEERTVCLPL